MAETTTRGTVWSITINNPTEDDLNSSILPPGWSLEGQKEVGAEGTIHYQGMLKTPQVRFSQIKKILPRAHIELAKNKTALAKYVHKEETRIEEVPTMRSSIPTLFEYQHTVAQAWNHSEWDEINQEFLADAKAKDIGDYILRYVDVLVARDIRKGVCGVEYIGVNPMWRSAWKKFGLQMVAREKLKSTAEYSEDGEAKLEENQKDFKEGDVET